MLQEIASGAGMKIPASGVGGELSCESSGGSGAAERELTLLHHMQVATECSVAQSI